MFEKDHCSKALLVPKGGFYEQFVIFMSQLYCCITKKKTILFINLLCISSALHFNCCHEAFQKAHFSSETCVPFFAAFFKLFKESLKWSAMHPFPFVFLFLFCGGLDGPASLKAACSGSSSSAAGSASATSS